MITKTEQENARRLSKELLEKSRVVVSAAEIEQMEVADFGLSDLYISGAQILTLVDNEYLAVKILVMLPGQTEPEHTHPRIGEYAGKHETIRCQWGRLYLFTPGRPTAEPHGHPPPARRHTYTVWCEHVLEAGHQVSLPPGTPHWFQGGPEGAVIWSFSTKTSDAEDQFTDPEIRRRTVVVED